MKEGGCDSQDLEEFMIGEEIGQVSLGGTLALHGCSNVNLYTVSSDNISWDADASVSADSTKKFPVMFMLGTPGDKCVLQHTLNGKTTDWAKIRAAAANVNLASGHGDYVEVHEHISKGPDNKDRGYVQVVLKANTNAPSNFKVYASGDSGASWVSHANVTWDKSSDNGSSTELNTTAEKPYTYSARALIRVAPPASSDAESSSDTASNSNDTVWWAHVRIHGA